MASAEIPAHPTRRTTLVALVFAALFVGHALYLWEGVVVDDAYVVFRYAQNLAAGDGLTFQSHARVEGYSCFSWVMVGALFERLGLSSATVLPRVGIALGAATVGVATSFAGRVFGRVGQGTAAALLTGLFLALSPGLAYYAGSGLETPLYCLLVVVALTTALDGQAGHAAVASSLALLSRPEGVVVASVALLVGAARAAPHERARWAKACVGVLVVAASYALFKEIYFGAVAPNTLAAKPPVLKRGLYYTAKAIRSAAPLACLAGAVGLWRRKQVPEIRVVLAAAVTYGAVCVAEGGDWMAAGRLLLPALSTGALALGAVAVAAAALRGVRRLALLALVAVAFVYYGYRSVEMSALLDRGSRQDKHDEALCDELATRMWQSGVRSVGTLDIGWISFREPGMRILDLGGLTEPAIAHSPGGYDSKHPSTDLLEREAPDAFVFTSTTPADPQEEAPRVELTYPVEATVAATPWFQERYRHHATLVLQSDYRLYWYARVPGSDGSSPEPSRGAAP